MQFDIERLREGLKDYYGTAIFSGFPMAIMEAEKVSRASDEELIRMAEKNGMNLQRYCK